MKTRRELINTVLSVVAGAPFIAAATKSMNGKPKKKPVLLAAGDDLRVSFEGSTLPPAISPQTMTFNYTVPDGTLYTATVGFIPTNMHPGHWDGIVEYVGPMMEKVRTVANPVELAPPATFSFDIDWKGDDVGIDFTKKLYQRFVI